MIYKIKPDPDCMACKGTGEVMDYVTYFGFSVLMPILCNCVIVQLQNELGDNDSVELDITTETDLDRWTAKGL